MTNDPKNLIAFQGELGANGDLACRVVQPDMATLPCHTFEDTFAAVRDGKAKYLLIPIDNTVAGRVADIHHLLPDSGLHIIGEHFQRVEHHLLAVKGTKIEELTYVHSHVHALNQCRDAIKELGLEPMVHVDTAAAARDISERGEKAHAAIASELAGEIYGLDSLRANFEDAEHNTTRFLLMAQDASDLTPDDGDIMTSFVFRVRNVPAALYKALGGFATNGVNMVKLESYLVGGGFVAAQFYAEVDGHPESQNVRLALEELSFFTHEVRIMGAYPRNPVRDVINKNGAE
ncbi:MAG: prephenate dehydratase [Rhodospirillaceae bacterium]|jgi:prephenate dehydratase|nr:prephenate dehydratase [Rhodospirillaceae bacterium]MBT4589097.1 prephenate dehydratase [Rhodospirillaceae bacterium]MBT4938531.1 prephenate dehydratase [Rhodospirillaceae bacterium]MBT5940812.1 prephenate dehydratase [Rhodospirillaceae bacterium]MBT7267250.1 prephenate dehydratase [Rhodospirillaceae bacterium]